MKLKKISKKDLIGKPTKSEKELLKLLTRWHKNATKRKFFIGEKKKA